ncbi:MAG: hypothetical protein J6X28_00165 [Bacilli bacterium]|nr:hypothetical protein [Bacilli bacterium]
MAKKIRQLKKKQSKLAEEDIRKNSGKEISHTISKIKAHERLYTFLLVIVFMVTISLSVFLGLKVDSYQLYDSNYYPSNFTMTGQLVTLSEKNVLHDLEGLSSKKYKVEYFNNTDHDINFLIRFAVDESTQEKCNCMDKIVDYQKIKFSLDGEHVQTFSDETMIISAGMIKSRKSDTFQVRLWLDDSLQDQECYFYGKFVLEELEDMDS